MFLVLLVLFCSSYLSPLPLQPFGFVFQNGLNVSARILTGCAALAGIKPVGKNPHDEFPLIVDRQPAPASIGTPAKKANFYRRSSTNGETRGLLSADLAHPGRDRFRRYQTAMATCTNHLIRTCSPYSRRANGSVRSPFSASVICSVNAAYSGASSAKASLSPFSSSI